MKLDKKTFGDTPAAMHLALTLNEVGSAKLCAKVSRALVNHQRLLKQLEQANAVGALTVHTVGHMLALVRADVVRVGNDFALFDGLVPATVLDLVKHLTLNVMIGGIKSMERRVMKARHAEQRHSRLYSAVPKDELFVQRLGTDTRARPISLVTEEASAAGDVAPRVRLESMVDPINARTLRDRSRLKLRKRKANNTLY